MAASGARVPNPSWYSRGRRSTTPGSCGCIVFDLPGAADVTLEVYSANGKRVRRLASGIHFYRLRVDTDVLTKKMVLIK